jgi:hypothetical protein
MRSALPAARLTHCIAKPAIALQLGIERSSRHNGRMIESGLVITPEWIEKIIAGEKTWEIRTKPSAKTRQNWCLSLDVRIFQLISGTVRGPIKVLVASLPHGSAGRLNGH